MILWCVTIPDIVSSLSKMVEKLTPEEASDYLTRIHYTGPIETTIDTLSELQRCHMSTVPFENLSVYGKERITLSKDWLFDKVVRRHRGGFCYELNTLYSLLLDYFGFSFKKHSASVYDYKTGIIGPPLDHHFLMVNIQEDEWMTDVAFGDAYLMPLRFNAFGEHQEKPSGIYRVRKDEDYYFYEEKIKIKVGECGREEMPEERYTSPGDPLWAIRYGFDLTQRKTEDFKEMLEYHQTDAKSPFTHDRICTIAKPWGRLTLGGKKLISTTYLGNNKVKKEAVEIVGGEEEVVKELEQKFGVRKEACYYPEGSMFHGTKGNLTRRV